MNFDITDSLYDKISDNLTNIRKECKRRYNLKVIKAIENSDYEESLFLLSFSFLPP